GSPLYARRVASFRPSQRSLRLVDTARPSARSPRPAAPVGCPRSFESALSSGRPSGLADPATRVASVAGRADAGPARDRRPVASRRVLSMVAASYTTSWKTTHRRRMPALGADGLTVHARTPKGIVTDLAYIPRESLRPAHLLFAGVARARR